MWNRDGRAGAMLILAVLAALLMMMCLTGCASSEQARAGYRREIVRWLPDGTVERETISSEAQGGLIVGADGKEATGGSASADAQGASSGGAHATWWQPSANKAVLYWIGAGVILLAIPAFLYVSKVLGLMMFLAGVGLLAMPMLLERYPWLFLVPPLILLAAVIYAVIQIARGKLDLSKIKSAFSTVVSGIEGAEESAQETVKSVIGETAAANGTSAVTKEVVTAIKADL